MLVIDVAGILKFIFWMIVIACIFGILGLILNTANETIEEWKKEGVAFTIIMVVGSIALAAIYLLVLINKFQG